MDYLITIWKRFKDYMNRPMTKSQVEGLMYECGYRRCPHCNELVKFN